MVSNRIRSAFAFFSFAITLAAPAVIYAQPQPTLEKQLIARGQDATPQPPAAAVGLTQNAQETRQQLYRVLEKYPPALGRVLRLDPTLLTNQAYLTSYPQLASFVAQYPDVPRNPAYYLERYEGTYYVSQPRDARQEAIGMWRNVLEFLGAFSVFTVGAIALFSIVKYLIEYRRWHRISKVNAEVHNKILDRFGSNEELLAYIDSPAGRRFLEATPIAPSAVGGKVAAPYGRILLSVQAGVLLIALALGFMWVSSRAIEEVKEVFMGLSIVGMALGLGCVVSAAASYALSRKLGLLPDRAERSAQSA
jgi:hypothetical protein